MQSRRRIAARDEWLSHRILATGSLNRVHVDVLKYPIPRDLWGFFVWSWDVLVKEKGDM